MTNFASSVSNTVSQSASAVGKFVDENRGAAKAAALATAALVAGGAIWYFSPAITSAATSAFNTAYNSFHETFPLNACEKVVNKTPITYSWINPRGYQLGGFNYFAGPIETIVELQNCVPTKLGSVVKFVHDNKVVGGIVAGVTVAAATAARYGSSIKAAIWGS